MPPNLDVGVDSNLLTGQVKKIMPKGKRKNLFPPKAFYRPGLSCAKSSKVEGLFNAICGVLPPPTYFLFWFLLITSELLKRLSELFVEMKYKLTKSRLKILKFNTFFQVIQDAYSNTESDLHVINADQADAGVYECQASNNVGVSE